MTRKSCFKISLSDPFKAPLKQIILKRSARMLTDKRRVYTAMKAAGS